MPEQKLVLNLSPSAPIGVFDSGVGGLSVLEVLKKNLPHEHFIYFGDTANMPYGERSPEEITRLVRSVLQFLTSQHQVKGFVVACNTSAGVLGNYWEQIDAVEPVLPLATYLATLQTETHQGQNNSAKSTAHCYRKIGLLATQTTINANRYQALIQKSCPNIQIQPVACTGLAKLIEDGEAHSAKSRILLQQFLDSLIDWDVDAIILGCTHYPFAQGVIQSLLSDSQLAQATQSPEHRTIELLDPALWMGQRLQQLLAEKNLLNPQLLEGQIQYFVSGDADSFNQTANSLPLHNLAHIQATQADINQAATV